jgi:hypothetical protein
VLDGTGAGFHKIGIRNRKIAAPVYQPLQIIFPPIAIQYCANLPSAIDSEFPVDSKSVCCMMGHRLETVLEMMMEPTHYWRI